MAGYLRGTGTQADPYVIHDAGAVQTFFTTSPGVLTDAYFDVINDIDCAGLVFTGAPSYNSWGAWRARLYGNGHIIKNFSFTGSYIWRFNAGATGELVNIALDFVGPTAGMTQSDSSGKFLKIENCFINTGTGKFCDTTNILTNAVKSVINNCVSSGKNNNLNSSVYIVSPTSISTTGYSSAVVLIAAARFLPSNYPALPQDKWTLDGVSLPKLIPNGRSDLTTKYAIKGSTKVGGISKKRKVAMMTAAYFGVLKNTYTDDSGNYLFDMGDVYDPVYIMHYDDYGFPLAVNTAYTLGTYIHPKNPNGYRYKCTTAGTSGAELPVEPWPTSSNLTAGTAIFTPEPVYKTETFLVSPHLYDFLTGQPV